MLLNSLQENRFPAAALAVAPLHTDTVEAAGRHNLQLGIQAVDMHLLEDTLEEEELQQEAAVDCSNSSLNTKTLGSFNSGMIL